MKNLLCQSLCQKESHPDEITIWNHELYEQKRIPRKLPGALSKQEPSKEMCDDRCGQRHPRLGLQTHHQSPQPATQLRQEI